MSILLQRILIYMLLVLMPGVGITQTISDYFIGIPDTSMLNLSPELRKKIIDVSLDNISFDDAIEDLSNYNLGYACNIIDNENAYLEMFGSFEGHVQMCSWELLNGNDMVAVYMEGCGPVCFVERFDFYVFDGGAFRSLNSKDILPDISNDFYRGDLVVVAKEMEKNDVIASLLFDLPQKGSDIVVKWGNEGKKLDYVDYAIGNRMLLKWNGERFVKREIYWSE